MLGTIGEIDEFLGVPNDERSAWTGVAIVGCARCIATAQRIGHFSVG